MTSGVAGGADGRVAGQAEHLLQPHRDPRRGAGVVDRQRGAGRRGDRGRRQAVEALARRRGRGGPASAARRSRRARSAARVMPASQGREPVVEAGEEPVGREVGQVGGAVRRAARRRGRRSGGRPGSRAARRGRGRGRRRGARAATALGRRVRPGAVLEREGAEHQPLAGDHGAVAARPFADLLAAEAVGVQRAQVATRRPAAPGGSRPRAGRRRGRRRRASGAAASGSSSGQRGALAAGEQVARRRARAALADAVGIGERERRAGGEAGPGARRAPSARRRFASARIAARAAGSACAGAGRAARRAGARGRQAAPPGRAAGRGPRRGRRGRRRAAPAPWRAASISMWPRRGCSGRPASARPWAVIRPAASSAPRSARSARASAKAGGRRRGQEGEAVGRGGAPERELEREAGEVGAGDLGRREGGERPLLAAGPEPVAPAGRDPAGAAAALLGLGAGDPLGDEAGHAGAGVEAGAPGAAGVDDDADVGDGQRGLGDRGGEDQPAAPAPAARARARCAAKGRPPCSGWSTTSGRQARREARGGAGDLGLAGQEDQHAALGLGERRERQLGDGVLEARAPAPARRTTAGRASGSRPDRRGPRR